MTTQRRWWQRATIPPQWVDVVSENQFVPMADAKAALGVGQWTIGLLVASGYVRYAATHEPPWYKQDLGIGED